MTDEPTDEEEETDEPTDEDVAQWMLEQAETKPYLYQDDAAWKIKTTFGDKFVYNNANGNPAISKSVLKAFNSISQNFVWSRGERLWRKRLPTDKPGRQQD